MPYKNPNDPRKKESSRKSSAKHYADNKQKVLVANAKHRKNKRVEWQAFKATFACAHCGFNHPAALDFHHVDRTDHKSVNYLAQQGLYKKAKEEIKKCIALCANCHRILHFEEIKNPAL
jgi:transcription elongation factor Elf1